ncbi:MAG: hypothetical protein K8U57_18305 [Planctomycetes bacterium]|nr:hypothetical protein [Planctomycetota bacterium]
MPKTQIEIAFHQPTDRRLVEKGRTMLAVAVSQVIEWMRVLARESPYYRAALECVIIPGLELLPSDHPVPNGFLSGKLVPEFDHLPGSNDWMSIIVAANEDVAKYNASQGIEDQVTPRVKAWLGYTISALDPSEYPPEFKALFGKAGSE